MIAPISLAHSRAVSYVSLFIRHPPLLCAKHIWGWCRPCATPASRAVTFKLRHYLLFYFRSAGKCDALGDCVFAAALGHSATPSATIRSLSLTLQTPGFDRRVSALAHQLDQR